VSRPITSKHPLEHKSHREVRARTLSNWTPQFDHPHTSLLLLSSRLLASITPPTGEKASIQAAMSARSNQSLSTESPAFPSFPTRSPPRPAGASVSDATTPLSPTVLSSPPSTRTPDVSPQQLRQLVHSLALTIQTRASQHASQVAGLKNVIADLEENLGQVAESMGLPP